MEKTLFPQETDVDIEVGTVSQDYTHHNQLLGAQGILNGTITVTNRETNEHRTFRIRTMPKDAEFAPGKRIIGVLTGPDNTASYTNFGFVNGDKIFVWKSKKGSSDKKSSFEWYAYMLEALALGIDSFKKKYEVLVSGRCYVCNRKLTDPDSIKTGIGPICGGRGPKKTPKKKK